MGETPQQPTTQHTETTTYAHNDGEPDSAPSGCMAAWLRAHTPVQEEHINALLQQEADGDVLDLLDKADLQSMMGDGLSCAHCECMGKAQKRGHEHNRAQNGDVRGQRGATSSHDHAHHCAC
jgi:hypothetical protein